MRQPSYRTAGTVRCNYGSLRPAVLGNRRCSTEYGRRVLFLVLALAAAAGALPRPSGDDFNSLAASTERQTVAERHADVSSRARLTALKHIQRSLEHYSLITAESLLRRAAENADDLPTTSAPHARRFSDADAENEAERALRAPQSASTEDAAPSPTAAAELSNFMRVRVGIRERREHGNSTELSRAFDDFDSVELLKRQHNKKSDNYNNINNNSGDNSRSQDDFSGLRPLLNDNRDNNNSVLDVSNEEGGGAARRHLRSASTRFSYSNYELSRHRQHGVAQHRRRRKGCPPMHGKEQLLCPSRNAHRYDVCVTREQLCNHVRDCPNGEDEVPEQCFFYKPLDDQLKTLSHAVLLVVESVMSEQQQRQRAKARDEDL